MGLNHETAPVQVREHFAVNAEQQGEKAREIIDLSTIGEAVVVSTCNRMELYSVAGLFAVMALAALPLTWVAYRHRAAIGDLMRTTFLAPWYSS